MIGQQQKNWDNTKDEIRTILIKKAKLKSMITYTELVNEIKNNTLNLQPHDVRLFTLLGEISTNEVESGRGMISVIVVHKHGDQQPGKGFFELAEKLGRDTSNILECWVKEFKQVFDYWSSI